MANNKTLACAALIIVIGVIAAIVVYFVASHYIFRWDRRSDHLYYGNYPERDPYYDGRRPYHTRDDYGNYNNPHYEDSYRSSADSAYYGGGRKPLGFAPHKE